MRRTNYLFILILPLILNIQGCNNSCEDIACFTPPEPLMFELVDKGTKENLFTSGAYKPEDITMINLATEKSVNFTFITDNGVNLIQQNNIGWQTETVRFSINHLNDLIFELYVEAERLTENCCTFTRYNVIRIQYAEVEPIPNTSIYRILVE